MLNPNPSKYFLQKMTLKPIMGTESFILPFEEWAKGRSPHPVTLKVAMTVLSRNRSLHLPLAFCGLLHKSILGVWLMNTHLKS